MNRVILGVLGISLLFVSSCTTADTTGNISDRRWDTHIEIYVAENGEVDFYTPIAGESSAETVQDTDNDPATDVAPSTALGLNGGTASLAAEGGKVLVDLFQQWQLSQVKDEPIPTSAPAITIPNTPPSKVPVEVPAEVTTPTPTDLTTSVDVLERGKFSKRHPENNRPYWYFKEEMKDYPADFDIVVEGCGRVQVRGNTGERIDWDEERNVTTFNENRNRWFLRQSLIPNDPRNMVLVAPQGCAADKGSELAYITVPKSAGVEYLFPQTYSMQALKGNNKYFTWLGWKWTDKVKSPVKFVFKDCGENLVVPNVQEPYGTDGSGSNHNQMFYFSGNPAKQEDTNNDFASIFGPPGCIAKTVDVYLSK